MKKMKLVMVGNGMAGVRTLEELLKISPDLYDITVFGAESHPNYNRILLSPVLAGEQTLDEIILNPLSWYEENGITLHLGKTVTQIDRIKRKVIAADGTEADYDRLLIATGSNPFILPVPGKDLDGVIGYRDITDTNTMIEAATRADRPTEPTPMTAEAFSERRPREKARMSQPSSGNRQVRNRRFIRASRWQRRYRGYGSGGTAAAGSPVRWRLRRLRG